MTRAPVIRVVALEVMVQVAFCSFVCCSYGQGQDVSLVDLKTVTVQLSFNLVDSSTKSMEDELRRHEIDTASLQKQLKAEIERVLTRAGFTVLPLEETGRAQARLDVCIEMRHVPNTGIAAVAVYWDCVQLVTLSRLPQCRFATSTWKRVWLAGFLDFTDSNRSFASVVAIFRDNVLYNFISSWRTANEVSQSLSGGAHGGQTSRGTSHGNQPISTALDARREYEKALAAYNNALSELNNMRSMADARRGLETIAPPPTSKFGKIFNSLNPAIDNYNIRSAEQKVEVARQRLEQAKKR